MSAQPSPAARITGTEKLLESSPHLSASGLTLAWSSTLDVATFAGFAFDLTWPCSDDLPLQITPQDDIGFLGPPEAFGHPSVSADGSRILAERHVEVPAPAVTRQIELWVHDRTAAGWTDWVLPPMPDLWGYVDPSNGAVRPTLSGDGRVAFYTLNIQNVPATIRHDLAANTRLEWFQSDDVPGLARTQSATNDLGSHVVGVDTVTHGVKRRTAVMGTGDASDVLAPPFPAGTCVDATMSGAIRQGETDHRFAWVADWDYCANGGAGAALPDTDVWLWLPDSNDLPVGYPAALYCDSPMPGPGILVRLARAGVSGAEAVPTITRSGNRVFFVSAADYWSDNPAGTPLLWYVDLTPGDWLPTRVPQVFDPTEYVDLASPNADGSVVAYSVIRIPPPPDARTADIRMAHVDSPGVIPSGMSVGPPHLPFQVRMQSPPCSAVAGGISVAGNVRAFGTATRMVLVTYEVTNAAGTQVDRSGPFIQELTASPLDDHAWVYELSGTVLTSILDGTCGITVTDASTVQPDVVHASVEFP